MNAAKLPMTTVVLVHGAWHGSWCWERVKGMLSARGVRSIALNLPSHGHDQRPLTDLYGDAAEVKTTLDSVEDEVVLVGHSYGGAVITEVGDHSAVRELVYLCAFPLRQGEACVSAAADEAASAGVSHEGRPDLSAGFVLGDDGRVTVDRAIASSCFYNDCDPDTAAWALDRLRPQSLVALQQSPRTMAWRSKPSTYVVCTEDLVLHPQLQRLLAQRCTTSVEWPCGHSPFFSQPERLVALVGELAFRSPITGT